MADGSDDRPVLYIAGAMSGYPGYNYPEFEAVRQALEAVGYTVLSPTDAEKENDSVSHQEWDWYMRKSLAMVLESGGVATLPAWENSRGARLEVTVAHGLSLLVLPWEVWAGRALQGGQ